MRIQVTQEHIKNGYRAIEDTTGIVGGIYRTKTCPIALAIQEQTPFKKAAVLFNGISLVGSIIIAPLPSEAERFVADYDRIGPDAVGPFEFELPDLPGPDLQGVEQ